MHHYGTHALASRQQLDWYLKLDYIGISLGMLGPFVPGLTLGFWCRPVLQSRYLVAIMLVVGGSIAMQLHPKFGTKEWVSNGINLALHLCVTVCAVCAVCAMCVERRGTKQPCGMPTPF